MIRATMMDGHLGIAARRRMFAVKRDFFGEESQRLPVDAGHDAQREERLPRQCAECCSARQWKQTAAERSADQQALGIAIVNGHG